MTNTFLISYAIENLVFFVKPSQLIVHLHLVKLHHGNVLCVNLSYETVDLVTLLFQCLVKLVNSLIFQI